MGSSLLNCLHRRKRNKASQVDSTTSEDVNLQTSQIMQHSVPTISTLNPPTHLTPTPENTPRTTSHTAEPTQLNTTNNPTPLPMTYQKIQYKGKKIISIQDRLNDLEYNYDNHDELVRQHREELLERRVIDGELEEYRASLFAQQGRQLPNALIPDSFYAPTAVPSSYYAPNVQNTQKQRTPAETQFVLEKDDEQGAIWRAGHKYG